MTQTIFWCVIFFTSTGASSAYLTVSEIFLLELRGQAISYFFALSQGAGGVVAPWLFGYLIGPSPGCSGGTASTTALSAATEDHAKVAEQSLRGSWRLRSAAWARRCAAQLKALR